MPTIFLGVAAHNLPVFKAPASLKHVHDDVGNMAHISLVKSLVHTQVLLFMV